MIEEPNPYNPKYRIQSHGYEAYAKDLRAWGDALKARVAELEAVSLAAKVALDKHMHDMPMSAFSDLSNSLNP